MATTGQGEIRLHFEGAPIVEGMGVDPTFIGKAIPAFTSLVEALCEEPDGDNEDGQAVPVLLARLNTSSCILRIQESDRLTPRGLSRFQEIIESFAEEDEEDTMDVLDGITDQSFNCLKKFLTVNASAETTFTVDHDNEATGMEEINQIKNALKLLRSLRKQETKEEGVKVKFTGYLPKQKKAEFTRDGGNQVQAARVSPKARGFEDLIQRIEDSRTVSLVTRQNGGGQPATTILTVE